ncbi:MAG: TlpA disulfide reductase family protein [bacterium]
MMRMMQGKISLLISLLLVPLFVSLMFLLPVLIPAGDYPKIRSQLQAGGKVPVIPLRDTLTREERLYLGIPTSLFDFYFYKNRVFSLQEIQADYIVLEFLNRYCVSCMAQAPILNNLYQKISKDKILRDRIKMLAVGAGNNSKEIQRFQEEKMVSFPIIPDPEFAAYEAFGNPGGTPYLLILRQSPDGVLLARSYLGLIKNEDILLAELKKLASLDLASFMETVHENPEKKALEAHQSKTIEPSWSEEEIQNKIRQVILNGEKIKDQKLPGEKERLGKEHRLSIQKKDWPGYPENDGLYIIDSLSPAGKAEEAGKRRWFAKVYNRFPLCDVCHPIYFLIIFNENGVVTDFLPLHITKYGNEPLSTVDTRKLKEKIVGRHLTHTYQFQPEYDSVTGATMSISLVFDTLNKARGLYQQLQQAGYAL